MASEESPDRAVQAEGRIEREAEVGYRRPPVHSRFQKGRSGNPKGRPRREASEEDRSKAILLERVSARRGGKTEKISQLKAVVEALVSRAKRGDVSAWRIINWYKKRVGARKEAEEQGGILLVAEPCATIEEWEEEHGLAQQQRYAAYLRQCNREADPAGSSPLH